MADLLGRPLAVANAGVDLFADELERQGVPVERVEWRPPEPRHRGGAARGSRSRRRAIARANDEAVERLDDAQPLLVGVGVARDLLPEMGDRTILHAGPPIEWADMSGPLRGAVIGAAVYEGLASDREDAARRAAAGEFEFAPGHERGAVGPMAGVVSAVDADVHRRERAHGNRAFCTLNEGLGKVLRFGAYDDEVLERLRWIRDVLARVFAGALERLGRADRPARDDRAGAADGRRGPQPQPRRRRRCCCATLLPALLELDEPAADLAAVARFIAGNDYFYLNLTMAAARPPPTPRRASSAPRSSSRWPATGPSSACG